MATNRKTSLSLKKIPWWQVSMGKKEQQLVAKVLQSNFPNEGEVTREFQKKIAKILSSKYVLMVPNATSAIFLSLKAVGVGFGDEVIVPDITFIATANAVEMTGAKAVLVDVKEDLTVSPESFEKHITKKTKAIVPVHVSGRAADMRSLLTIAKKHNIAVIEDAAEAFTSKYNGKNLGTIGDTGCFSLSPAKTITTGQGGFIVTNNEKLYKALVELKDQGRPVRGTGGDDIHYSIGFNFKFTDIQAAVGIGQLSYLQKRTRRMRRNHMLYKKYLNDVKEVRIYPFDIEHGELPQWTDASFKNRDQLDAFLKRQHIDCRKLWFPIHCQKPYKMADTNFPNSSKFSAVSMWLPSAFTLSDPDIKNVCNKIRAFYGYKNIK